MRKILLLVGVLVTLAAASSEPNDTEEHPTYDTTSDSVQVASVVDSLPHTDVASEVHSTSSPTSETTTEDADDTLPAEASNPTASPTVESLSVSPTIPPPPADSPTALLGQSDQPPATESTPSSPSEQSTKSVVPPTPSTDQSSDLPIQPEHAPDAPILTSTDAPPPEFLSFNEWKQKYAAVAPPESSARRSKKAAQRARQEAAGGGLNDPTFDGDGADLGSLFANEEGSTQIVYEGNTGSGEGPLVVQLDSKGEVRRAVVMPFEKESQGGSIAGVYNDNASNGISSSSFSPIQPLPNVGTGHPTDPLLLLKDRYNYALFGCAAMVHRASRQSKGATSILVEKKDQYMLTPCAVEKKFVELELCDEIRIDTIVLANFEFFSSMFKKFEIKVSQNYPGRPDEWHDLGTFRARNIRGVQVFYPKSIGGFYRYMRIDFISHYGSEFYCPVSLLRVYGLTQMDAFRREEEHAKAMEHALASMTYDTEEDDELDGEGDVDLNMNELLGAGEKEAFWANAAAGNASDAEESSGWIPEAQVSITSLRSSQVEVTTKTDSQTTSPEAHATTSSPAPSSTTESISTCSFDQPPVESSTSSILPRTDLPAQAESPPPSIESSIPTSLSSLSPSSSAPNSPSVATATSTTAIPSGSSQTAPPAYSDSPAPLISEPFSSQTTEAPTVDIPSHTNSASSPASSSSTSIYSHTNSRVTTPPTPPSATPTILTTTTSVRPADPSRSRNETRPPIMPAVQQPQPGESIYGTIMKRLTSLEQNQTLSMHYIEAQGQMLRDAFGRVEKRLDEVELARLKHDQLIRQAMLDFEKHHLEVDRDRLALASQVNILSQELLLEKRLGVAQLLGLLALFVFVGMTRGSPTTPFLHMVQGQGSRRRVAVEDEVRHEERKREERRDETRRAEEMRSESSGDVNRKHQRVGSLTTRGTPAKRPLGPKATPRRHYSGSNPPKASRPPRSWTPPPSASLPFPSPDDVLSPPFEPRDPTSSSRRRSVKMSAGSPRPLSPLSTHPLGLYEDSGSSGLTFPFPTSRPPSSASRSLRPKSIIVIPNDAQEADTEPSSETNEDEAEDVEPFSTSANDAVGDTDERGYNTFSEDEDQPALKDRVNWPVSGSYVKPPKASVGKRPSTAPGPGFSSPRPPSRLPVPPPEQLKVSFEVERDASPLKKK